MERDIYGEIAREREIERGEIKGDAKREEIG